MAHSLSPPPGVSPTPTFLSARAYRTLLLAVAISAVGYLALSLWSGWSGVARAVRAVGVAGTAIALGLSLVNYILRFARWQYYLGLLRRHPPLPQSLRIYLAGFALTTTPGKFGEAVRSVLLKPYGVSYRQSVAAFFAERLSDLAAIAALASLGLWSYPAGQVVVAVVVAAIIAVMIVVRREQWITAAHTRIARFLPARLARWIDPLADMTRHFAQCFSLRASMLGFAIGVLAWAAEAAAFFYFVHVLGHAISATTAAFIYSFALLVGALSFLPGGLGGVEATMIGLLLAGGMPGAAAVTATVMIRLATLWFAVVVGLSVFPRTPTPAAVQRP